jgi:hypothetical protein
MEKETPEEIDRRRDDQHWADRIFTAPQPTLHGGRTLAVEIDRLHDLIETVADAD